MQCAQIAGCPFACRLRLTLGACVPRSIAGHSYCWDLLGVERATADTIQAAAEATPPPVPAPGEDADTVLRGRMKQLKALLPEEVTFSHLRITLAHMQRTAAQAPDLSGAGPAQPAECVPASRV